MKKSLYFLATGIILLQACNYIEIPRPKGDDLTNVGVTLPVTDNDSTVVEETGVVAKVRKVLVEDYTGHHCGNCPLAAIILDNIQAANPERVVGIAVHAGNKSTIMLPFYTTDHTTTVGKDWNAFFQFDDKGYPNGMINRKGYPANGHIRGRDDWAGDVALALAIAPDASIHIRNTYFKNSRVLKTQISNEYLTAQNATFKLSVLIVENGIIDDQTDYSVFPDHIPNYEFNHMLRASLNNTWGDVISTGTVAIGAKQTKDYQIVLPAAWNAANCKVVAFIYNSSTYEVMQAEELKIVP